MNTPKPNPDSPIIYTALGRVRGTYRPSAENVRRGVLITDDALEWSATLDGRLCSRLKKQHPNDFKNPSFVQELFKEPRLWRVYPRTQPLSFRLTRFRTDPLEPEAEANLLDSFRLVGEVTSCGSETVQVKIRRNGISPPDKKAFTLTLTGSLPPEAVGQIWELFVHLIGATLKLETAQPFDPASVPSANAQKKKKSSTTVEKAITPTNTTVMALQAPSPRPAYSSQPEPSVQTQTQQQGTRPTPESQHKQSQAANPTQRVKQRVKQQRPTKTPPHLGQNQQRSIVQSVTQQRDQASLGQKQSTTSTPSSEPQSGPPRFSVKVNDQVFSGYDSVTLHKRVVRVDGVPVGQAKMVIVLGQPRTLQADGGVSQGRKQAVLTSR